MPDSKLPPELISLVYHVELNKAGWWERAVQRLIVATIWLSGECLTPQELAGELQKNFSINIDPVRLKEQIDTLCSAGTLVPLSGEKFKISEHSLRDFEKDLSEAEEIEEKAKGRFIQTLKDYCPSLQPEETWKLFDELLLLPLVREMGARVYELISGARVDLEKIVSFANFLQRYPAEARPSLRNAIISFLDPKNLDVRSYIMRYLNAYLFLEAGNLSEDTLGALTRLAEQPPSFIVFVDTNFVFSILGLHENPSNEAAQSLINLISQLGEKIKVKLYVLPPTIDETKRVLYWYRDYLGGLHLPPNLSEAAARSEIRGVVLKFAEESRKAGHPIKAKDYFDPYLENLIQMLRSKGVEFFDERLDGYKTNQEVIDNIMQQLESEKSRLGDRAKSYEKLEHDMILWQFVRDKRPARVESPLEAGYWVVTVDFRFMGFDAFKRDDLPGEIPVCLHPAALMQMFQFWVPRTPEFEEAVLGSLRLPFLFQEFDPVAEKATIRILETLTRFENVSDLSQNTITAILVNAALRQKLLAAKDIEEQIELVREALIEENERVRNTLKGAQEEAKYFQGQAKKQKEIIAGLESQLHGQKTKTEETQQELQKDRETRKDLEARLSEIEKKWRAKNEQEEARKQITRFVLE